MAPDYPPRPPEHFLELIRRQQRGRLKIYLGFAAGVGKTYEMLQEGQRLKRQGIDVVIGIVETHGRAETAAQIGDLEQVPRRRIQYHDVLIEEMDLDAILHRQPTVALVNELAHTNAPGSRNAKRYQDVEELLRAGIHVISTLNIQHLESLHDIVEQATGVKVKERIPDYVVSTADQIVNVDLSAEDLRERLESGKVYPSDRINAALENFFQLKNLNQLRELAMKEIVLRLGRRLQTHADGEESNGSERVMVAIGSRSPNAAALLRKASHWPIGSTPRGMRSTYRRPTNRYNARMPQRSAQVANTLTLAQQLGGVPLEFKGVNVISTIAAFVKEYGVTHIVIGRTRRPWYRRWLGQSVLDQLLRTIPGVNVLVVDSG